MSNKLPCPTCGTQHELPAYLQALDADHAFGVALKVPVSICNEVLQYIELFAPRKQSLTLKRRAKLIESMPLDADIEALRYGIDMMLGYQAQNKLTLPLKNHNYLKKVMDGYTAPEEVEQKRYELSEKQVMYFAYELVNDSEFQSKALIGESTAEFLIRVENELRKPEVVKSWQSHLERVGLTLGGKPKSNLEGER